MARSTRFVHDRRDVGERRRGCSLGERRYKKGQRDQDASQAHRYHFMCNHGP
jgi:hypothetical protein